MIIISIKEKIPHISPLIACIPALLGLVFGILFFVTNHNEQNLLTYLENKYYQSFKIDEEITYDEYLEKINDSDYIIPEDDYIKAYTVYPEECPEYVFVVGEYEGTMGHFLLPGKETVQFDTYDVQEYLKIIGKTEETEECEEETEEECEDLPDNIKKDIENIEKYLEKTFEISFVVEFDSIIDVSENNETEYINSYIAYPKDCPEYTFIVGQYTGPKENYCKPYPESVIYNCFNKKDYEICLKGSSDSILEYLEEKYNEKFVVKEEIRDALAGTDIHGGLYQIDYISAYLFSPADSYSSSVDNGVIMFAAGILLNDDGEIEYFDCYEEVMQEKVPPYVN